MARNREARCGEIEWHWVAVPREARARRPLRPVIARRRSRRSNPGRPRRDSRAGGVPCGPARFWIASPALRAGSQWRRGGRAASRVRARGHRPVHRHCEAAKPPKQSSGAAPRIPCGRR